MKDLGCILDAMLEESKVTEVEKNTGISLDCHEDEHVIIDDLLVKQEILVKSFKVKTSEEAIVEDTKTTNEEAKTRRSAVRAGPSVLTLRLAASSARS